MLTPAALAGFPTVVASSTAPYVSSTSFGYINKLVVDPFGNIFFTDSSNGGAFWEIPVGTTTPVRITQFVLYASVSAGGSGYTSVPTITFSAPPAGGTAATGVAVLGSGTTAGQVTGITITYQGSGYSTAPTVTIAGGGGSGATGTSSISINSTHGFTVDQYGDVILGDQSSGDLYFFPNKNGHLVTTSNAAGTEPLNLTGAYGFSTQDDYYFEAADEAIDKSGNLYIAVTHCNSNSTNPCGTSGDSIFKMTGITNTTTSTSIGTAATTTTTTFINALPGGKPVLNMALDNNGHLFYVDGTNVYVVSLTSGAQPVPTVLATGFTAPSGISVDAAGNVYVVDNSTKLLTEIPNEGGTVTPADKFVVASLTNPYYSVGFDAAYAIYQADGTDKVVNKITLGALNLTASPVGTASTTGVMNFRFNAATAVSSFSFVQGTGAASEFKSTASTCTATTYAAGGSCAITVSATPASTGTRKGAIVLLSAANKPISTGYLSGTGTGAALTVDPGTQTALTAKSAWITPSAVALDPASNIYVADSGANVVQVIAPSGTAIATIGSGLSKPAGVAADGAGNVFISDTGNNRIVEVPNEAGTLNTADQAVVVSGLNSPTGIAIDATGALYVANTGAATPQVFRFTTFDGLSFSLMESTVGTGFTKPSAITTDNAGNVYVADKSANNVSVVNLISGAQSTFASGLSAPTSISLDASGSLYVVNSGSNSVVRYPNVGGSLNTVAALSLGTLTAPTGVAVNGSGNVAISDAGAGSAAPTAYTLVRTAGYINFGNVNITLQSSTQNFTLTAAGTTATTLAAVPYTATGNIADFNVSATSTNGCAPSLSLSVGSTCGYAAYFAPVVPSGTLTETLTFNTNAVNASSETAVLTGVATNLSLTTTTLAQVSPAAGTNPIYGQAVTVTATVTTARSGVTPTGTVKFYLDGNLQSSSPTLSLTAPYTASITIPGLGVLYAGTHTVTASYSGDANDASSNTTAAQTLVITVTKQPTTTVATILPAISQPTGSTFTFSVAVSPTLNGTFSAGDTVSLVAAGTTSPALVTAKLQAPQGGGSTYTATLAIPVNVSGQYQVIYSGDTNYLGSTSNTLSVSIQPENYTITLPSNSFTVNDGSSITIPITITGISGYLGNVTLGGLNLTTGATTAPCTGLPAYVTCVFSPGIVALANGGGSLKTNPTQVFNLTVATSVPPATPYPTSGEFLLLPGLFGAVILSFAARKRKTMLASRIALFAGFITLAGLSLSLSACGSGNSTTMTPKGTSGITLTFSGTPANNAAPTPANPDITNTANFQLTVQ